MEKNIDWAISNYNKTGDKGPLYTLKKELSKSFEKEDFQLLSKLLIFMSSKGF